MENPQLVITNQAWGQTRSCYTLVVIVPWALALLITTLISSYYSDLTQKYLYQGNSSMYQAHHYEVELGNGQRWLDLLLLYKLTSPA